MSNRPSEGALTGAEIRVIAKHVPGANRAEEPYGWDKNTKALCAIVARIKAEAVQAERERIAREIEALRCPGSPPSPLARYAYETAKEHAAEIARSEGR